jgi:hypothetical protein
MVYISDMAELSRFSLSPQQLEKLHLLSEQTGKSESCDEVAETLAGPVLTCLLCLS